MHAFSMKMMYVFYRIRVGTIDKKRTPKTCVFIGKCINVNRICGIRDKILVIDNLDCFYCRFVNALVYFGINLNVGNLAGDMFLNFFILCIVEIPGALLLWFFMSRYL